jgi:hypothetical protein
MGLLLPALLLIGLVLRVLGVPYAGTYDLDIWMSWGEGVHRLGLAKGYDPAPGSLFPFAYQVFGATAAIAQAFDVAPVTALKAVNLVFDTATLVMLIAVLRQWNLPVSYALVYWLNPYFVVTSWLGYVDFHPVFFVVLTLYLVGRARTTHAYVLASLPLGIATAMKPQELVVVAMLIVFVVVRSLHVRRLDDQAAVRAGALLAGPAAVFIGYSVYFAAHGRSLLFLVRSYRDVGRALPALTAQMPNIWYPIAELYTDRGEPITSIVEPDAFHALAAVLTAGLLLLVATRLARDSDRWPFPLTVLLLFTAGAALLPMVMTRAHENHFFLAAALGVVVIARLNDRPLTLLANALLAIQAVHLFGLYGLGENRVTTALGLEKWLDAEAQGIRYGVKAYALDHPHLQTAVASITTVLFIAVLYRLSKIAARSFGAPLHERTT